MNSAVNYKLLTITFIAIILVGGLHQVGSIYSLYWDVSWFDTLVHFVGGLSMGLLFLWVWHVSGLWGRSMPSRKRAVWSTFIFVLMAGFGWEVFEYVFDIANPTKGNYFGDTSLDLIADLVGGLVSGFIGGSRKFYE